MWKYTMKKDGTILIKEYLGAEEVVVIPAVYDGYEVSEVGESWMSIFYMEHHRNIKKVVIEEGICFVNNIFGHNIDSLEEVYLPKSLQGIWDTTCERCAKLGFVDLEFLPKHEIKYPNPSLGCTGNWGKNPVYYPAASLKDAEKEDKIGLVLGYIEAVRRGKQIDEQMAEAYNAYIKRSYKFLLKEIGEEYREKFEEFTREHQLIPPSMLKAGTLKAALKEPEKLNLKGKKVAYSDYKNQFGYMRLGNVKHLLKKEEGVFVEEVDEQTDYLVYNIQDAKYETSCELKRNGHNITLIPYDAFWILMDGKMVRGEGERKIFLFYAQHGEQWPFFEGRIKKLLGKREYMPEIVDELLEGMMKEGNAYAFGRLFRVRYDFEKKNNVLLEVFDSYIVKATDLQAVEIAGWLMEEKKKLFSENMIETIENEQMDKAFGVMDLSLEERFPNRRYDAKKLSKEKNKPYSEWKVGDEVLFGIWMHGRDGALKAISWKILEVKKDKILLVAKEIVHRTAWKYGCTYTGNIKIVNEWLAGFYETAFDMSEKERILPIKKRYATFLTREEAEKYMPDQESRRAKRTAWAYAQNHSPYSDDNKWILKEKTFTTVLGDGRIREEEFPSEFGVRPVICISIKGDK